MPKVRFTLDALEDTLSIGEFLLNQSGKAFDAFNKRVADARDLLSRHPQAGHIRRDLAPASLRFLASGDYFFIYRKVAADIQIIAILHAARDIPSILSDREVDE